MFYLFEKHYGDDNDNAIADVIFEGSSLDVVWKFLTRQGEALNEASVDGDGETLHTLFYPEDACENGGDCSDKDCDADHRVYHRDFYLQGEFSDEASADKGKQYWHANGGTFTLNDDGTEAE